MRRNVGLTLLSRVIALANLRFYPKMMRSQQSALDEISAANLLSKTPEYSDLPFEDTRMQGIEIPAEFFSLHQPESVVVFPIFTRKGSSLF